MRNCCENSPSVPVSLRTLAVVAAALIIQAVMSLTLANAATHHVPGSHPTIQAGIDASLDGDVVIVAEGIYTGDGNRDITFLGKAITLRSESGAEQTVIDCEGTTSEPHRGIIFNAGEGTNCIVDGFTIRNGSAEYGGGIFCNSASPTIRNCIIISNSARLGAGILCVGNPAIVNCIITDNSADYDGGAHGGGIYCYFESIVTITDCDISGNNTVGYGGGILCVDSDTTISRSSITGNFAYNGGGISCFENGNLLLVDCILTANSASYGGGLAFWSSVVKAVNCTVTANSAANGGGVYTRNESDSSIVNSILWDNSPQEILFSDEPPTVEFCHVQDSAGESWLGQGCTDADPQFESQGHWEYGEWVNSNLRLKEDSLCIDAGNNNTPSLSTVDKDGDHRTWYGCESWTVDIGAYEYASEPFTFTNAVMTASNELELRWNSCGPDDVTYSVWFSDGPFSDSMEWTIVVSGIVTSGISTNWVDYSTSSGSERYYKIRNDKSSAFTTDIIGILGVDIQKGRNLVSIPFVPFDTSINAIIADKLTGHPVNGNLSDNIETWDPVTLRYRRAWYNNSQWLDWIIRDEARFDLEPGIGFWINIKSSLSPARIYFVGKVPSQQATIEIHQGRNMCGLPYPASISLENSGLIQSGFTGHPCNQSLSDNIEWWDASARKYDRTWYNTDLKEWRKWDNGPARNLNPAEGFWVNVKQSNSPFIWICPKPYDWVSN